MSKKPRQCGDCQACCTALRIDSQPGYTTRLDNGEDVAKPAGEKCRFLADHGCGIYEHRPAVCRKFACDWLQGRKGFHQEATPHQVGYLAVGGSIIPIPIPLPYKKVG